MTVVGYQRVKDDLKQTKQDRIENSKAIEIARGHGDLSENADYHAAKEKQSFLEGRIQDLESRLALSEVIDPTKLSGDKVVFGATVTIQDCETESEKKYQIVGSHEANIKEGKLSVTIGMALIAAS